MKKSHRIGALIAALVFFLTSVGFTIIVIMQINDARDGEEITSTVNDNDNQAIDANTLQEGALQGTKLENFTPVENVESLQKIDLEEGNGEVVKPGDTVTAHYTGALAKDGTIFQSSLDFGQPIPFSLNEVIQGWTEGVPGMKVGGKRRLVIPAAQAYGESSPSPDIPANSDLVFDIELVAIGDASQQ